MKELLNSFPDLTDPWTALPPKRGEFDHHIDLTGSVKRQRIDRLSPAENDELARQCQEYLSMNHNYHIRPSTSSHATAVLFARKQDGGLRLCVDYQGLNEKTVKDAFPLPRVDVLLVELRDAKVITHLNLMQGYHQARVAEEDVWKRHSKVRMAYLSLS